MYIGKVKYGDNTWPVGSTLYGTCDTAAGTAAKVVTMPDFDTLLEGVTIHVKFTHSNGAHVGNATLNVNNTGAKTIMRYGTTAAGIGASASWNAGAVVSFTYDGTYWLMNDWVNTDTNTTYTFATGDSNGQIKVTPSSGSAYNVSVKGLGDRAFDSTSYLPLSGGTLTNNSIHILNINNTGEDSIDSGISFSKNGARKARVGYNIAQGAYLFNNTRLKYLSYTDNGALLFEGNNVWHAGNDGSGSGLDADLLDGTHKADLITEASLGASGNSTTLSVTVGGTTKTGSVTVPYATSASKLYQTVVLPSSGPSGKEKWYKFATLTFNTSVWLPFDHYLFFGSAEGSSNCPNGILRISGRAGNPSTTLSEMTLYWIILNNTWYISRVKTVKTGDNVYDLYILAKEIYVSMVIYLMNLNNNSTLQFYTNNSWGNLPSNAVRTSVLGGTTKYSTQLLTARTFWGQSFDGTGNVNGAIYDASCLEFTGLGSSSGHGGYIDFHYNGSTADYTSRLIEESSGNLTVYGNNLKVNGYPVFHSTHELATNGEDIPTDKGIGIVGCHGKLPASLVSDFASGNAYYNTPTGISPYNWGQVLNFFYHPDNCHFLLYVSDASSAIDMNGRYTGMFYRSGWASSGNPYYNRRPWRLILDNASILTYYGLMLDQTSTHSILKMAYPKTSNFYNVLKYGGTNANSSDLLVGSDSKDTHIQGRDIYVDAGNYSNCIFVDNSSGSVGVGTTSPSYKLHVNGACAASSFPNTSDIRLKDIYSDWSPNIEDIAYAPSFLFKWKDGKDKNMHAGTSAQYWLSKAPELVTEAKDDIGTLSIQYDVLGALSSITLAKEILELKKEIKRLQALIAEIKLLQK